MTRNIAETMIGAMVLIVAAAFLYFAYDRSTVGTVRGYEVSAKFTAVGPLREGADVRISGIKVGSVIGQRIDPDTFLAQVTLSIDPRVRLPADTAAVISQDGLLGDAFISLDPGISDQILQAGSEIIDTAPALDLFGLINQLVYSQGGL